jgi:hypothetical protein
LLGVDIVIHTETGQPAVVVAQLFAQMKTFNIKFIDNIVASSEEEAYNILLKYLSDCAHYGDATAFEFAEESAAE